MLFLTRALQRYAVDLAEIGTPCLDQPFLDDPSTTDVNSGGNVRCANGIDYANCDACLDIDRNESEDDNQYISQ